MDDDNEKEQFAQEIFDSGGVQLDKTDDGIKGHLAIDAANPLQIFDRLNELEIDMVKRAGHDLRKIESVGRFIDDVRFKAKTMLAKVGVHVDIDIKESNIPAEISEPIEI